MMTLSRIGPKLLASALMMFASGAAYAQAYPLTEFNTPKFDGKQTVGPNAVAIEATMLASTAVNAAAVEIATSIETPRLGRHVIVIGGAEAVDFGQVSMIRTEILAIHNQLTRAMSIPSPSRGPQANVVPPIAAWIPALAGMMRSDVDYSAAEVSLDPRILPSAVAKKLSNTTLFSALSGSTANNELLKEFGALSELAISAQMMHDTLASKKDASEQEKRMVARLAPALKRYDAFFMRVTTANDKGIVPLSAAARLAILVDQKPLILRVNIEKIGGTTVKRTNLLTFFGADGLSISGGLVASYQLTDPELGAVAATGLVTCRTALAKLKSVQDATWKVRVNTTDNPAPLAQTAVCRRIN